ncbi:MAG: alpha/beta hydrolase [Alphaproteobacteria bacterium]|nr:alpha/beta hydrolase [Alphaproteobacteria bacterium]
MACIVGSCSAFRDLRSGAERAEDLMEASGWAVQRFETNQFSVLGYVPSTISENDRLAVYIEGDGASWITPITPPRDPTPNEPLMLRLALQDPTPNRLYLGRPCQYLSREALAACDPIYWTSHRYAPEVVKSLNEAIEQRKRVTGAKNIALFGYSGSGGLAILIASKRQDVRLIVTIAGNLDHAAWTKVNHDAALQGSLNAADIANAVAAIPQFHFVGLRDKIVPPAIVKSYVNQIVDKSRISIITIADIDHTCCWVDRWPALICGVHRDHCRFLNH